MSEVPAGKSTTVDREQLVRSATHLPRQLEQSLARVMLATPTVADVLLGQVGRHALWFSFPTLDAYVSQLEAFIASEGADATLRVDDASLPAQTLLADARNLAQRAGPFRTHFEEAVKQKWTP